MSEEQEQSAGLGEGIRALVSGWRRLTTDVIELAALETRLAGHALVLMIGLGVAAALLLVTAWLLLVAMLIYWLAHHGLGWQGAMFAVATLQVVVAVVLIVMLRRASRHLLFAGTRGVFYESEDEPVETGDPVPAPESTER
ncbi:MAG: phage holin family protein [Gammaproteobacteria bacterium]